MTRLLRTLAIVVLADILATDCCLSLADARLLAEAILSQFGWAS